MSVECSVSQAGRLLGVSEQTVRIWFDAGQLEGYRTSSNFRRIVLNDDVATEEHLTVSAAARLMNMTAETVRSRFDAGRLQGYRLPSGQRRITRTSAERLRRTVP